MPGVTKYIDIMQMAKQLFYIRQPGRLKTALVLGARAGGLFRSPSFLTRLQPFMSERTFTSPDPFAHAFHVLSGNAAFGPTVIQAIIRDALAPILPGQADKCLAALIMQGYFDPVISTNGDSLLEQALANAGWRDTYEFQVVDLATGSDVRPFYMRERSDPTLFKVFGEIAAKNYVLTARYAHISPQLSRANLLSEILRSNCLIVGFDTTWDSSLFQVIPAQGEICWIAAEKEPQAGSLFYSLQETREISFFVDQARAPYEQFFVSLYNTLEALSTQTLLEPVPPADLTEEHAERTAPKPIEIFISHHPKDTIYLEKLLSHLTTLKYEKLIKSWFSKNDVLGGQSLSDEIERHLNKASLILLLVSDDLLADEDIYLGEIQQAMILHRQKNVPVIPILLRPVEWINTEFGRLSPLPDNGMFVEQWPSPDNAFRNIVQGIRKHIRS